MRLLLSGYYGLGNLGDEAILAGLAPTLSARGVSVSVLSGAPQATAATHGVAAVDRFTGVLTALPRADALVSGGGGLLQDATSARSLDYYLGLLRAAKLLGKRTAVYAQSLGPLSAAGRAKVARALAGVPLAVRDEGSRELALELGLEAELVADPALLLSAPERTPSESDPLMLIPRGGHDRFNLALERLARAATGETVALAMHPRFDGDAVTRLQAVQPRLERLPAATPGEALARVAAARVVVSVRLHGCILAALARVPFVALAYDPKVAGFAAQVGAEVVDPDATAAELEAACERARPASEPERDRLRSLAERGIEWLLSSLTR